MKDPRLLGDGRADDSLETPELGVSGVPGRHPGSVNSGLFQIIFHLFEMKLGHGINRWPMMFPGLPLTQGQKIRKL